MDLDEVKVCLRGLISSTAFSYNLSSLLRDFKRMTGFELPLFGYLHPIEFLQSLDDTVKLFGDPYNPELALVESRKSAHITSLVDRQRTCSNRGYHYAFYKPKRLIMPEKMKNYEKENKNSVNFSSPLRNCEKSLTASAPLRYVDDEPNDKLPDRKVMTKSSETDGNEVTDSKIPSVGKMNGTLLDSLKSSSSDKENGGSKEEQVTENNGCNVEDTSDRESGFSVDEKRTSCCLVNNGIKNKFKKIIKNYPNGLWCCELPKLFLEEYDFPLDYREFGYTSLIQMVSELPDVFRYIRPGNEDWILFDASVAPSPEENKMLALQAAKISTEVTGNMKKLLSSCSDVGVELENLLKVYERMFGTFLDFQSMGFNDLKSFLRTWEGSLLNFLEVDGKTFVVPLLKTIPQSSVHWREAVPPITPEDDIFAEIFPEEVVGPEEGLLELDLTCHIAVGQVVKVSVADVWSPSKFYLQLNKFKSRLNLFMDEMQKFYNIHLNKYKMPESTIRPKQICAGLYAAEPDVPEEWYRARIVKVINDKIVLINLTDFGTIARIKKTQLRFLHRSFQSFPVQGFLAQLSGVAPVDGSTKWPMSTCKKFLDLVRVPSLDAEMVDIDFKKPSLSVHLFYQSETSSTSINQELILEKLACEKKPTVEEFFPLVNQSTANNKNSQKKVFNGGEDVSVRENLNKNLSIMTDEFLDITDLGQTSLFPFKTKCLKDSVPLKNKSEKVENLKYEFEEVPDLEFNLELKASNDTKEKKEKEVLEEKNNPKFVPHVMEKPKIRPHPKEVETEGDEWNRTDKEGKSSAQDQNLDKNEKKEKNEKKNEYMKEIQIGDKTIHLITIGNQMYFSADEIIQKFTSLSSREVADKIFRLKKIITDYRVISKETDEKVLKELRSELHPGKKLKKLKIYLISAAKVVLFLQNLGSFNKTFEQDVVKLLTTKGI